MSNNFNEYNCWEHKGEYQNHHSCLLPCIQNILRIHNSHYDQDCHLRPIPYSYRIRPMYHHSPLHPIRPNKKYLKLYIIQN